MLLFLWFLCEKLQFKSLVQVLQVQRASYATLPETKDAHFWPSMTGHSKCWFIAMYGFRNGLWHGHEIGKQFFIKTQISLKTRNERTGNFQSIQKTMNILVFSGTVFFYLILGAPSVCVHLSWSVRERLIHVFTNGGYTADVYLNNFYGTEHLSTASAAFERLQELFDELG